MKCQTRGTVPSVAIDKTDGILTYLSKETLDITQFITSKSSDMQISFPNAVGDSAEIKFLSFVGLHFLFSDRLCRAFSKL